MDNGNGQVLTAFGDTAGLGIPNLLVGSLWSWRSNVLFRSSDRDLADGMTFDSTPRDIVGQSKELIPSPKIPFVEISRIPTAGIAADGMQYMSIMSSRTGRAGKWETNYSSLAFSTDNGENWVEATETRRPPVGGNLNFQMVRSSRTAIRLPVRHPAGPRRPRVPHPRPREADARPERLRVLGGGKWVPKNPDVAAPIVFGGVGEISVQYNSYLGQYLMLTPTTTTRW